VSYLTGLKQVVAAMTKAKIRTMTSRLVRWRHLVQAGFLLVWLDPLMLRLHNVCGPVFHCYSCPLATFACPIGVLANFGFLHVMPFIAIGTLFAIGALVGSFVCGWACPFGFLQDLIGKIPTPRFRLPAWSGNLRYLVLIVAVVEIPVLYGEGHPLFICRFCPAGALEGAAPNLVRSAITGARVVWPSIAKMTVLILVLLAIFFTWRPWCTLLCPLGAIYGIFNRISVFFLRFHPKRCTDCGICLRACRFGIEPDRRANDPHCIRCLECTGCGALTVGSIFGRSEEKQAQPQASD